jgi:hypothetical protein
MRKTGQWQRGSAKCHGHQRSPTGYTPGSSPWTRPGLPEERLGGTWARVPHPTVSGFDLQEARNATRPAHKHLYTDVHSSSSPNSQKSGNNPKAHQLVSGKIMCGAVPQ